MKDKAHRKRETLEIDCGMQLLEFAGCIERR